MKNEAILPSAVIFDMDGVLIDSEPIHSDAMRSLLSERALELDPQLEADVVGCNDREIFRLVRAHYGLSDSEADLVASWTSRVVERLASPLTPLEGVPAVLHRLRGAGIRLALASSSSPAIIAATLRGLGLADMFELIVSGHDVRVGKPSPDIFLEAARRLGVPPVDCLVIEDSFNGLAAAVAAGMRCVVVPCGSTAGRDFARATVCLRRLTELPEWIGL